MHVALQSRFINPRLCWCYADEDYMGVIKTSAGASAKGTGALQLMKTVGEKTVKGDSKRPDGEKPENSV